jgi:aldehyde dehydrogenase (NAD+)
MSTFSATQAQQQLAAALTALGITGDTPASCTGTAWPTPGLALHPVYSPTDGHLIGRAGMATEADYELVISAAERAALLWREVPAPKRGEVVRQIGEAFRTHKESLAVLVSYEMGKIYQEGLGEVQEIIDICDFAVGLSRQLYGLTMPSERPDHRIQERWHPLGVVGVISAFNFPVAVWSWNAMLAAVCGNSTVWKPSEKTPLTAIAVHKIIEPVLRANHVPEGTFGLVVGKRDVGELMANDPRVALVSATGSVAMGRAVGTAVAKRMGKSLLELGGNNAIVLAPSADLKMALQAIVFGAVGTTGQRCTSTRRLIVHESLYASVKEKLAATYGQLTDRIGHPLDPHTLIGPLIDADAVVAMQDRLKKAQAEGGKLLYGGAVLKGHKGLEGHYVQPAIIEATPELPSVQHETFAPILYVMPYKTLDEAIAIQNGVPQGLSSAIFTTDFREAERYISAAGSDCGIANVNIGTSGAEIGGAFGGEKETGGGRESGTDSWKAYMRRQTITVNYGTHLPLAQGIKFEV